MTPESFCNTVTLPNKMQVVEWWFCTSEELGDTHIIVAITGEVLEELDLPHKIEDYTDMFSAEKAQ